MMEPFAVKMNGIICGSRSKQENQKSKFHILYRSFFFFAALVVLCFESYSTLLCKHNFYSRRDRATSVRAPVLSGIVIELSDTMRRWSDVVRGGAKVQNDMKGFPPVRENDNRGLKWANAATHSTTWLDLTRCKKPELAGFSWGDLAVYTLDELEEEHRIKIKAALDKSRFVIDDVKVYECPAVNGVSLLAFEDFPPPLPLPIENEEIKVAYMHDLKKSFLIFTKH